MATAEELVFNLRADAGALVGGFNSAEASLIRMRAAFGDTQAQAQVFARGLDFVQSSAADAARGADSAGTSIDELGKKAEESGKKSSRLADAFKKFGEVQTGVEKALGNITGAFNKTIGKAISLGDAIEEGAARVGLSTTEYQRLGFAARQAGVEQGSLESALTRIARTLEKARQGGKDAKADFERLGIGITAATQPLDVLNDLADKAASGTADLAQVADGFGGSVADLLPLLKEGSSGISAMGDQAERLGNVIDEKAVKQSAALKDQLDRLLDPAGSLAVKIGNFLVPALAVAAKNFEAFVEQASQFGIVAALVDPSIQQIEEFARKTETAQLQVARFEKAIELQAKGLLDARAAQDLFGRGVRDIDAAIRASVPSAAHLSAVFQDNLKFALKNSALSADELRASVVSLVDRFARLGLSAEEQRQALAALTEELGTRQVKAVEAVIAASKAAGDSAEVLVKKLIDLVPASRENQAAMSAIADAVKEASKSFDDQVKSVEAGTSASDDLAVSLRLASNRLRTEFPEAAASAEKALDSLIRKELEAAKAAGLSPEETIKRLRELENLSGRREESEKAIREVVLSSSKDILEDETRSFTERKAHIDSLLSQVKLTEPERKEIAKRIADAEVREEKRATEERKQALTDQVEAFKERSRQILESDKASNLERKISLTKFLRETGALEKDQREKLKSERTQAAKELTGDIQSLFEKGEISFSDAQRKLAALKEEFPEFAAVVKETENKVNAFRLDGLRRELDQTNQAIDNSAVNERQRLRERIEALEGFGEKARLEGKELLDFEKSLAAEKKALRAAETQDEIRQFDEGKSRDERRIDRELKEEKASRDRRRAEGHDAAADLQSIDRLERELFDSRRARLEKQIKDQKLSADEASDLRKEFFKGEAEAAETAKGRRRIEREALKAQGRDTKAALDAELKGIDQNAELSKEERAAAKKAAKDAAKKKLKDLEDEFRGRKKEKAAAKGADDAAKQAAKDEKDRKDAEKKDQKDAAKAAKDKAKGEKEAAKAAQAGADAQKKGADAAKRAAKNAGALAKALNAAGKAAKNAKKAIGRLAGQVPGEMGVVVGGAAAAAGAIGSIGAIASASSAMVAEGAGQMADSMAGASGAVGNSLGAVGQAKDALAQNFARFFHAVSSGSGSAAKDLSARMGGALDVVGKKKDRLIKNIEKLGTVANGVFQGIPSQVGITAPPAVTVNVGPVSVTSPMSAAALGDAVSRRIADSLGIDSKV